MSKSDASASGAASHGWDKRHNLHCRKLLRLILATSVRVVCRFWHAVPFSSIESVICHPENQSGSGARQHRAMKQLQYHPLPHGEEGFKTSSGELID